MQQRCNNSKSNRALLVMLVLLLNNGVALPAHAQGLEDTIEAELDMMNDPAPAKQKSAKPKSAPAPVGSQAKAAPEAAPSKAPQAAPSSDGDLDLLLDEPSVVDPSAQTERPKPQAAPQPEIQQAPQQVQQTPAAEEPTLSDAQSGGGGSVPTDEPNVNFEKRMYRIYKKAQPMSSAKWEEMVGPRRAETYKVQAGDTLWDISTTMFGDGQVWSKLWAENGRLENPHQISPGQGIQFVSGTEDKAPSVSVVKVAPEKPGKGAPQEELFISDEMIRLNVIKDAPTSAPIYREQALKELTPEELANGASVEVEELIPAPEIPKGPRRAPVMKSLPGSFVTNRIRRIEKYDSTGLDIGERRNFSKPASITPQYFLSEGGLEEVGRIEEAEAGEKVASAGQNVFVKLNRTASNGEKFSIMYERQKIKDSVRGELGPVIEVGGQIEVLESVGDHTYRALVLSSLNPIRIGSIVTSMALPKADFTRTAVVQKSLRIIGGEMDENRKLIGAGAIVYLDGGSSTGVNVGDVLRVQSLRNMRRPNSKFGDVKTNIGLVKIVKVESSVCTGIVLESEQEIVPGDMTGGNSVSQADFNDSAASPGDSPAPEAGDSNPSEPELDL